MRTIADLQDIIAKAFAQPASKEPAELLRETVVAPPQILDDKGSSPLRNLLVGLKRWPRSSLRDRLSASEAASAAKSRRIATVVHEVRTPLNGILGMTHLLSQTKLTAEQQNYLSGIRQSGHMLAQLVDDILDLSTMEAGRFRLNTRAENLRQLLESVVEMLSPRAHEKRIEIAATFTADLPELLDFDPARLRQVLFNVIGNAVKFTVEGGVLVRGLIVEGNVEIAVSDTGPGMTEEDQVRIFGEFEQFGSSDSRSGGTGLGLSITARILAEFGGSLSVRSRVGEGSVFTIRFPVQRAEDAPAGETDRSILLRRSRVLLLAPHGPAAQATIATIEALGGRCRHLATSEELHSLIDRSTAGPMPFTDLIVDHRLAASYACEPLHKPLHRILLVNPEERASQPQELFDAWLIRPLREKSLVDVLSGRLRGFGNVAPRDQTDRETGRAQVASETVGEDLDRQTLDIVLAEDDPVSAMLVRAMLQREGHRVRWVADVPGFSDALHQADARTDLIITDMNMPGGDPLDILAAFRVQENGAGGPSRPFIVLTGDSREESTRLALQAGARKILQKPVNPALLSEEIRAILLDRHMRRQAR
ncbi:ATP-binding protein [Aliirhizobium terrae]|uniref:ATP-binding response regulator n=1 Tax=Terrirhizobium terrae TaxID=2926709 RepID=UPI002578AD50|nr:ATP-binding protein [Rhizobium sp. CC-CFT758]WJH42044.1 ATP-binding protein [Rhizobium sp. CC-CFT758]